MLTQWHDKNETTLIFKVSCSAEHGFVDHHSTPPMRRSPATHSKSSDIRSCSPHKWMPTVVDSLVPFDRPHTFIFDFSSGLEILLPVHTALRVMTSSCLNCPILLAQAPALARKPTSMLYSGIAILLYVAADFINRTLTIPILQTPVPWPGKSLVQATSKPDYKSTKTNSKTRDSKRLWAATC
jgi:hypothetical protein